MPEEPMFSQQPDQKNLLLAIVLSMGVLLGWQYFYAGPKMKEEQERAMRQKAASQTTQVDDTSGTKSAPAPDTRPGATSAPAPLPAAPMTREEALRQSSRVGIETGSVRGSIALRGARIDDINLVKYRETVDPKSPNVTLFSPSGAPHPYYTERGWVAAAGSDQPTPDGNTLWTEETKGPLTPTSPVRLVWDNGKGLVFHRTISIDQNYMFLISDEIENKTGSDVTLFPFGLVSRHGQPKTEGYTISHEGLIGVIGSTGLLEVGYGELVKEADASIKKNPSNPVGLREYKAAHGGWLGFADKYWGAVMVPSQGTDYDARLWVRKEGGQEYFQVDYRSPAVVIPAGGKAGSEGRVFAGAKEVRVIDSYKTDLGIQQFDSLIDWGTFWYITKPLFHSMDWLNRSVHNFGVVILIITLIVKLIFFPLANRSYASMAKMKKLQPEMERIRERFKDDQMRQQQELMALYKKEKINPLAGCLPILIQIPVFFALYKVLFVTIDMRHAPFFGWIKDLSAPDPTSLFNLFGLLPIPPIEHFLLGYTLGAWPLVMGLTMWLQMQLNPQQPDPVQQQIFNWMPVIFTFMLGGFASGLVIYWAWSNALSIAQQWVIMHRQGVDVPILDNLRKTFQPVLGVLNRKRT
jgi:YidC/Oxa1 family membrane protein insertase